MSAPHLPSPAPSPFPLDAADLLAPGIAPVASSSATPSDEAAVAAVRADVEARLLSLAQDLYEMEVCAGEVSVGMEDAVPNYLSKIATGLASLAEVSGKITETVPWQVVENIDRYKNPHQYTKSTLSRATGENQYALGRVLGLESFRRQLVDSLSSAFPALDLPEREHQPIRSDVPPADARDGLVKLEAGAQERDGLADEVEGVKGVTGLTTGGPQVVSQDETTAPPPPV
ncbi:hypothetical protein Q5752_003762 [Cryptotrichosporon argae]